VKPKIRAIETRYAGCRFRSRTEARYAVFMDRLGLVWEYEPQGFVMDGTAYLPDFYLPRLHKYLEIKGGEPSWPEVEKVLKLAAAVAGEDTVSLLKGDVPRASFTRTVAGIRCEAPADGELKPSLWLLPFPVDAVDAALTAARSARFEHGENG
jgi:hypothetical protein